MAPAGRSGKAGFALDPDEASIVAYLKKRLAQPNQPLTKLLQRSIARVKKRKRV